VKSTCLVTWGVTSIAHSTQISHLNSRITHITQVSQREFEDSCSGHWNAFMLGKNQQQPKEGVEVYLNLILETSC
jgi:hypothetical protein